MSCHRGRRWLPFERCQPPPNCGAYQRPKNDLLRTYPQKPREQARCRADLGWSCAGRLAREPTKWSHQCSGRQDPVPQRLDLIPRRPALATALAPASSVAPPIVDNAVTILFERAASAAPAKPPISAANTRSLAFSEAGSGGGPADISWAMVGPEGSPSPRPRIAASVPRQSQTSVSAQIRGAAGMRVGRRRAPPLPDGHLSIAAKRSLNREDIGSAATDATWRSPTGVLSPVRGPALGRWRG